MQRISNIEPADADGKAAELMAVVQKKIGMVPNLMKVMANAPAVLQGYLLFADAASTASFDARTREAIALAVAGANGCDYCASAHAAISGSLKVESGEIRRRLQGESADPALNALLGFVRAVVAKHGLVDDQNLATMRAAGYSDGQIIEAVGNVALNLLTNYINHVAHTEIDFPRVDIAKAAA